MPRVHFSRRYQSAIRLVITGVTILAAWLILLFWTATELSTFYYIKEVLLITGGLLCLIGITIGCWLDYSSIKKVSLQKKSLKNQ